MFSLQKLYLSVVWNDTLINSCLVYKDICCLFKKTNCHPLEIACVFWDKHFPSFHTLYNLFLIYCAVILVHMIQSKCVDTICQWFHQTLLQWYRPDCSIWDLLCWFLLLQWCNYCSAWWRRSDWGTMHCRPLLSWWHRCADTLWSWNLHEWDWCIELLELHAWVKLTFQSFH